MRFQRPSFPIKVLIGALAALFVAGIVNGAMAADRNWTGAYIGGSAGMSSAVGQGLGADGYQGGVTAGAGVQLGSIYLGGFLDYDYKKMEWNGFAFDATELTAGGRGGIIVTNSTMIYALIGMVWLDAQDFNFNSQGIAFGGGMETMLSDNLSAGVEYRRQTFDDLPNGTEHVVKAVFKWHIPASAYQALDAPAAKPAAKAKKIAP